MLTQYEAIIQAFEHLRKPTTIREMEEYISQKHGDAWKDIGTVLEDMVSTAHGGNHSSKVPNEYRVLKRISRGQYALLKND
ncbi:hypothetical protein NKR17_17445 [Priestia flexa]|uniref:hypothetical protein n=1 Tax=Priestia flexa TaxID=86664 RepID=UPI00209CBFEE|nr:hypothetical protein [Priestia flexa]MCP1190833.1 hypothetical protein [Priestia flexa]